MHHFLGKPYCPKHLVQAGGKFEKPKLKPYNTKLAAELDAFAAELWEILNNGIPEKTRH